VVDILEDIVGFEVGILVVDIVGFEVGILVVDIVGFEVDILDILVVGILDNLVVDNSFFIKLKIILSFNNQKLIIIFYLIY
jgi:hypothetical protein